MAQPIEETRMALIDSKDQVTVIVGRTVSIAAIKTPYGDFVGEAKRTPGDRFNYQVGYNLALGRAMQTYGEFLEDQALARSDALALRR